MTTMEEAMNETMDTFMAASKDATTVTEREVKFRKMFEEKGVRYPTVEEAVQGFARIFKAAGLSNRDITVLIVASSAATKEIMEENGGLIADNLDG